MFLKGNTIALRAMEPSDADLLFRWENDRNLWAFSLSQEPLSHFILDEFVNAVHQDIYTNRQLRLMIDDTTALKTIGIIDLFDFDPQHSRCGIGIFIQEDSQKKGFASESVSLIKDYCFQTLFLKQLYVHVSEKNADSLQLFEKAGFEKSGLKKAWHKIGFNTFEDVWFLQCIYTGD